MVWGGGAPGAPPIAFVFLDVKSQVSFGDGVRVLAVRGRSHSTAMHTQGGLPWTYMRTTAGDLSVHGTLGRCFKPVSSKPHGGQRPGSDEQENSNRAARRSMDNSALLSPMAQRSSPTRGAAGWNISWRDCQLQSSISVSMDQKTPFSTVRCRFQFLVVAINRSLPCISTSMTYPMDSSKKKVTRTPEATNSLFRGSVGGSWAFVISTLGRRACLQAQAGFTGVESLKKRKQPTITEHPFGLVVTASWIRFSR